MDYLLGHWNLRPNVREYHTCGLFGSIIRRFCYSWFWNGTWDFIWWLGPAVKSFKVTFEKCTTDLIVLRKQQYRSLGKLMITYWNTWCHVHDRIKQSAWELQTIFLFSSAIELHNISKHGVGISYLIACSGVFRIFLWIEPSLNPPSLSLSLICMFLKSVDKFWSLFSPTDLECLSDALLFLFSKDRWGLTEEFFVRLSPEDLECLRDALGFLLSKDRWGLTEEIFVLFSGELLRLEADLKLLPEVTLELRRGVADVEFWTEGKDPYLVDAAVRFSPLTPWLLFFWSLSSCSCWISLSFFAIVSLRDVTCNKYKLIVAQF